MATVTLVSDLFLEPRDDRALYVWLGPDGRPQAGDFAAFQVRQPSANVAAAESDWDEAEAEAIAQADQLGFPTVYVIKAG
ncbi:MAG: hypothetical protein JSR86_05620 [Proteobacteria bacterium]|nr:hypothetical protein [Pseudomonadota bacterium]